MRNKQAVFYRGYNLHYHQQCTRVLISPHPHQYLLFPVCFFLILVILVGMESHSGFDLHFHDDWWCQTSFCVFISHLYVFFAYIYIYIQVLCQFLHWVVSLFVVELHEFFTYHGYKTLTRYMICKHFPPFYRLSFHFLDDVLWCTKVLNCYEVQFIYFFPLFLVRPTLFWV